MSEEPSGSSIREPEAAAGAIPGGRRRRRSVIAGGVAAGVVVVGGAALLAERGGVVHGGSLAITVNGKSHQVASTPDTPLLYVLRDEMGLRGPKFGCGLEQCGACAVLVGPKETRTCMLPVSQVKGAVTTLEGLPGLWAQHKGVSTVSLHPVQQAWIDEQVPQCGYCQNGMMVMAVDLLTQNAKPSAAQIRDAFTNTPPSAHLCRCGTYDSIIKAVQRASTMMA